MRRPNGYVKKKTPLHWAAEEGDANTVEKMLWNGFYIDHKRMMIGLLCTCQRGEDTFWLSSSCSGTALIYTRRLTILYVLLPCILRL